MQLKAAIDKFFAFPYCKRTLKIQSCALLVCSGAPNEDGLMQ